MITQRMTGTTMPMTHGYGSRQPSQVALATRSLRLANRLHDEGKNDEYREAITQHFATFAPSPAACRLR